MVQQAVLFFEFAVHQVENPALLLRALLQNCLKQIPCSLDPRPPVAIDELGDVHNPNVVERRPLKKRNALLKDAERLFIISILLQQRCKTYNSERSDYLELQHPPVRCPKRLKTAEISLQVDVELP